MATTFEAIEGRTVASSWTVGLLISIAFIAVWGEMLSIRGLEPRAPVQWAEAAAFLVIALLGLGMALTTSVLQLRRRRLKPQIAAQITSGVMLTAVVTMSAFVPHNYAYIRAAWTAMPAVAGMVAFAIAAEVAGVALVVALLRPATGRYGGAYAAATIVLAGAIIEFVAATLMFLVLALGRAPDLWNALTWGGAHVLAILTGELVVAISLMRGQRPAA